MTFAIVPQDKIVNQKAVEMAKKADAVVDRGRVLSRRVRARAATGRFQPAVWAG